MTVDLGARTTRTNGSSPTGGEGDSDHRRLPASLAALIIGICASVIVLMIAPPLEGVRERLYRALLFPKGWTFIDLENDARVQQDILLRVEHPADVDGRIWIIQQQHKNAKYFPSAMALDEASCSVTLAPTEGTSFDLPIRIGEAHQRGERFTLILAVANRTASDALARTLKAWCEQRSYPGLSELPSGLTIKHKVEVQRLAEP